MDRVIESLREDWEALLRLAPRLLAALLILILAVVVGRLLGRAVTRLLERSQLSPTHRQFFRRVTVWAVGLLGLVAALNLLGMRGVAASLLAGGGITAVVLGFAFRSIGENLIAGFLLAFNRPFELDNLIQSGEFKGTVRGIALRYTHIRTADGRDIYIPNAQIFNSPLINYTRDGLLRPSFTVGIDYRDDAAEACRLLAGAVRGVRGVAPEPEPAATVSSLEASWVLLEVGFWVDTFAPGVNLLAVRGEVVENCRRTLIEAGFTVSSEVTTAVLLKGGEGREAGG